MPSLTLAAADLRQEGAVVEVTLAPSGASRPETSPRAVRPASLLVDTGASQTFVRHGLLAPLGLHSVGVAEVTTPSSRGVRCALYAARIGFQHGHELDATVVEGPPGGLEGLSVDGLLGRDVLRSGLLIYLGEAGQFTLGF